MLKEDEMLMFLNKDIDILGNDIYTEYIISKINKELHLKFKKKTIANRNYRAEFKIRTIQSIKKSSMGEIVLPNFISENDILKGTYKEGYSFSFENIVYIKIIKESHAIDDKVKKKN